ncbi:MAG: hypothetical protein ACRD8K_00080 [Nitrososphaeraceae archaeon]
MVLTLTGSTLALIWLHAEKTCLLDNGLSSSLKIHILIQMIVPPLVFLFSIPISFIHVDVAQYFWLAIIPLNFIIRQKHQIKNV